MEYGATGCCSSRDEDAYKANESFLTFKRKKGRLILNLPAETYAICKIAIKNAENETNSAPYALDIFN